MITVDKEAMNEMIARNKRLDSRELDQFREIKVEAGVISSAEGSSRVCIGKTEGIAGVKMDLAEPFPDSKDEGVLMVNAEFVPLAFEKFETGPPSDESIELARVVDRTIRESQILDMKKLCIKQGEKVWTIFIDIDIIDHDGNLIDAATLASVQALLNTRMPKMNKETYEIDYKTKESPLPINGMPVSLSFVKISGKILIDPSLQEEDSMDARFTVGVFEQNSETKFCAMQKGGTGGFTMEELDMMLDIAEEKSRELRNVIKE